MNDIVLPAATTLPRLRSIVNTLVNKNSDATTFKAMQWLQYNTHFATEPAFRKLIRKVIYDQDGHRDSAVAQTFNYLLSAPPTLMIEDDCIFRVHIFKPEALDTAQKFMMVMDAVLRMILDSDNLIFILMIMLDWVLRNRQHAAERTFKYAYDKLKNCGDYSLFDMYNGKMIVKIEAS